MRKQTKGKWFIVRTFAIMMVFMLALTACGKPNNGGDPDPGNNDPPVQTQLATPTELKVENALLKWRQVTDAESYRVTVGESGYDVTARSFDLTPAVTAGGEVVLGVTAKAAGYLDSAKATLTVSVTKLAAPEVDIVSGDSGARFEWAAVTGAAGYTVSLDNGATWRSPQDGLTYAPQAVGSYRIVVKALGNINGTAFYIDGDASAQSEEIIVSTAKPLFSADPATGLLTLSGGVDGATRYALFVDDVEKADVTPGVDYDLYASAITATGVYTLRITAYTGTTVISTSVEYAFDSRALNSGELFSFDNKEGLPYGHKSENVTITVQDAVKHGTGGYAARLDITSREYAQIDVDLTGRHTFSNGNEYISYWAYFVKPEGFEGTTVTQPSMLCFKNTSTSYSWTADGSPVAFDEWTQLFIPIPQWNSYPTTMSLVLFDNGELLGDHTVYIDDLYVHSYAAEHAAAVTALYPQDSLTFFGITDSVNTPTTNYRTVTLPNTVPLGEVFVTVKLSVDTFNGTALAHLAGLNKLIDLTTEARTWAVNFNAKPHYTGADAVTHTFTLTVDASRTATLYYNDFLWNEYINIEIISAKQPIDISAYDMVILGSSGSGAKMVPLPAGLDVTVGSTYTFTVDFYVGTVTGDDMSGNGGGNGRWFAVDKNATTVGFGQHFILETPSELPESTPFYQASAFGTPIRFTVEADVLAGKTLQVRFYNFNANEFLAFNISIAPSLESVYDFVYRGTGSGASDTDFAFPVALAVEVGSTYTFTVDFYVGTVTGGNLSNDNGFAGGSGRRFRIANNLGGVALDWIYLTTTTTPTYPALPAFGVATRISFTAKVGAGKTFNASFRYFNTNEFIAFDFVNVVPAV